MDLELSPDEEALQDGVRRLCEGRFPMATVRALAPQAGVDRALWRELADAGVFSLRADGMGATDAVLVFEELGRALVPGPLVWSHLAAGLVDGAATGERVVGGALVGGEPLLVEHLDALDALLVLDGDRVRLVDRGAVDGVPVPRPLDPLTPLHHVESLPRGEAVGGADVAARLQLDGAALVAASLLGIAEAVTDMAVAYAKQREQFGRPIGSFQAVKHLLADMLTRTEVARAAVYAAGVTLHDPGVGDPARAVAGAKLIAGEAAFVNGKACIQVHGGMGFTWEVDAHLYLKRARVLDTVFGPADVQAERMAAYL
ncbi:MAG: acyl-CoA dehydrogenase [Actinobacteria bacterium]|nr:MAG: acyl-CoA dehydrogenase [Actinomycetota bacterium]